MNDIFSRTQSLLGREAMEKLKLARVAIFGVGGVGGYTAEALARSGIGRLELIDSDCVSKSNINRQIIALHSTVGTKKVEAAAERLRDINPELEVSARDVFFLPETSTEFDFSTYDYVVDCIDTVGGKLEIIKRAKASGVPVISSMGAGNKLDPTAFRVAKLKDTRVCPLARVMRTELAKRGIHNIKVVYSEEVPKKSPLVDEESGKPVPGSVSFVPSVVGLIMAGEIIKDITNK